MAMAVKITRDLAIMMSCIDPSVRKVTKSSEIGPLLILSISLGVAVDSGETDCSQVRGALGEA
jgi:hypothetical protein